MLFRFGLFHRHHVRSRRFDFFGQFQTTFVGFSLGQNLNDEAVFGRFFGTVVVLSHRQSLKRDLGTFAQNQRRFHRRTDVRPAAGDVNTVYVFLGKNGVHVFGQLFAFFLVFIYFLNEQFYGSGRV